MSNSVFNRARWTGYTLLEVTIVLVVLGVMASLAVPRYAAASRSLRVNHAANVVASDLELAAAMAAQRHAPVDLLLDAAAPGYSLVVRGSNQVVLRRTLGPDSEWRLGSLSATPAGVSFFPNGTLSSPLRLVLTDAGHHRTVTASRAGLVRVLP
ncbi:MAG TPA: GspH/FimT family pseudopilin [Gemmatimonadaceae bacterium]